MAMASTKLRRLTKCRRGTEKEKDMKRTVSLLTAALFAGALAAPVLAQSPAMEASPAASPSMAAPSGEMSPSAEASPTTHHRRRHHMRHRRHRAETETSPSSEMSPSGGEASPSAAPSGQEAICDLGLEKGRPLAIHRQCGRALLIRNSRTRTRPEQISSTAAFYTQHRFLLRFYCPTRVSFTCRPQYIAQTR